MIKALSNSSSISFKFLTTAHILRLHCRYIQPYTLPTQPTLLDSAAHAPLNTLSYDTVDHHSAFYLAANLAEKIMRNHAFQDGNKRTALSAAATFLRLNGYQMKPREDGLRVEEVKGRVKLEDAIVGVVVKELDVELVF